MTMAEMAPDMLMSLVFGVFCAFLYLRAGNLFIGVGVHALANQPASIVQSDFACAAVNDAGADDGDCLAQAAPNLYSPVSVNQSWESKDR